MSEPTGRYAVDVEDHVYEVATGRRLSFVEVGALLEELAHLRGVVQRGRALLAQVQVQRVERMDDAR